MRALGATAAARCEQGKGKRCRCRCGGRFHGRKRGDVQQLQPWDPHHPQNRAEPAQLVLFTQPEAS